MWQLLVGAKTVCAMKCSKKYEDVANAESGNSVQSVVVLGPKFSSWLTNAPISYKLFISIKLLVYDY